MRCRAVFLPLLAAIILGSCAQPRNRGQILVFAKGKDAVKLDANDVSEGESSAVVTNLYDTLVEFKDETTELQPGLATRWEVSRDGLTYTFHLRPNVRFHDGTPCDAEAVVFNFRRQMDLQSPWRYTAHFSYWADFFKAVSAVEARGLKTVIFHLKEPDATFLTNLALFALGVVSPTAVKTYKEEIGSHPVGTGPFKLGTWVRGEKIVLVANADYWGGKPAYDKLIFKPVPDLSARLLQLENGEIHGMDGVVPDDVPRIEANPDLQLLRQPGMNIGYLTMNNAKPPFNDRRVRQAVAYAMHKEAYVKAFFAGGKLGSAAINPTPPTIWGHNDSLKPVPHDPAKARQLMAAAGYPNGFDVVLWSMPVPRPYMPQPARIAEAIQADLRAVGIRAALRTYDWGIYLEKLGKGEHEMALMGWIGDNGDPDNFLYTLCHSDNARPPASNNAFYKNSKVDALLSQAKRITDQKARTALYEQAQAILYEDVPLVPLFHATQVAAFRKGITGYHLNPVGMKRFRGVKLPGPAPAP